MKPLYSAYTEKYETTDIQKNKKNIVKFLNPVENNCILERIVFL